MGGRTYSPRALVALLIEFLIPFLSVEASRFEAWDGALAFSTLAGLSMAGSGIRIEFLENADLAAFLRLRKPDFDALLWSAVSEAGTGAGAEAGAESSRYF